MPPPSRLTGHRFKRCPYCAADPKGAPVCPSCGRTLSTVPEATPVPSSSAVGRFVRCPACATTVIARAEACSRCGAALAPRGPAAPQAVTMPRHDIVGGCLLAAVVFLAFVVLLVWLLGPSPPRG